MRAVCRLMTALALAAALTGSCAAEEVFHRSYLRGFPDGSIRPENIVTRAEFAEILFRMQEDAGRKPLQRAPSFPDVPQNFWAYGAIEWARELGLMRGFPDGSFRPEAGLTGRELCIILERLQGAAGENLGALAEGWAQQEITFEAGNGWVMGLHDGVFEESYQLTRGDLAGILNRVLGRAPQSLSNLPVGMLLFPDNLDTTKAYFLDIQEAALDHTAEFHGVQERWTGLG